MTQKYPVSIFGSPFRVLVTLLVPAAFLNFYPAVFLLRKPDAPPWLCMLAPLAAALLILFSRIVWKQGLRRYNSSGS